MAREMFGEELQVERVWIIQAPAFGFYACAPFRNSVLFGKWRAPLDFGAANIHEQGWLIHELAHVWQAQSGVVLPLAKLGAVGKRAYAIKSGAAFSALNIEAQAEVARGAFLARRGYHEPSMPPTDELKALWREALS